MTSEMSVSECLIVLARTDLALYLVRGAAETCGVEAGESVRQQLVGHVRGKLVQQNLT